MIVKSYEVERYVDKPPPGIAAVLIYGPDRGLVSERASRLAKSVVSDLNDPFRVSELDETALDRDPARLRDEAQALSMTGGNRVVRVSGAGNGHAPLFESFLESFSGGSLIVVEAGDLAKSAALPRVFADADNAAVIACYPDTQREVEDVVRNALKADALTISEEALDYAGSHLGSDRGVTRQEIEKLALYAHGLKRIELKDVQAVIGDESETGSDDVCDAAGEGDLKRLDLSLERLWLSETSPVSIIRAALSHFQRLALVRARTTRGEAADQAMKSLRPPPHFSRATSFKAQVQRWTEDRLLQALDLFLEAETLCKTTATPGEAVCGRALFNVAAMARARG